MKNYEDTFRNPIRFLLKLRARVLEDKIMDMFAEQGGNIDLLMKTTIQEGGRRKTRHNKRAHRGTRRR
jgi:hypothetical protein